MRVGVHRRLEEAVAGAAQALGVVHRGVRVGQQRMGVLAVIRVDGDADAGGHQHLVAVHHHRPRDGFDQAVGHIGGVGWFHHFAEHDEFVAAQARHRVLGAQGLADALGQVDQQGVAGMVAVGVVDRLESVQVEEQHGEIALAAAGAFDGLFQPVFQQDAVGQLGQRVVQRQLHQFLVGLGQRRGQRRGAGFEAVVQHRHHQGDGQHAEGDGGDRDGEPAGRNAGVRRHADAAVRKARGFHAGVVHADDRQPHDHGRQRPRQRHPRPVVAQAVGDPERRARGRHRDGDGQGEPGGVVDDARHHAHGRHADIVHGGNPRAHQQGAAEQAGPGQVVLADDPQREGGAADGDGQRQHGQRQVVAHGNGQVERQHADEMHGPDADAHRQRAAAQPIARRRQPARRPHAVGHAQRRIRRQDGDP